MDGLATSKNRNKAFAKAIEKTEIVKMENDNRDKFNTITDETAVDALLIRAMIDKTTRAHEGTRLRFKLLDDVCIKNVKLETRHLPIWACDRICRAAGTSRHHK